MSIWRRFKSWRTAISEEISFVIKQDPSIKSSLEVIFTASGLHAIWVHRFAHLFYQRGWRLLPRMISQFVRFCTGIEIHPGAKIGKCCFIDHGCGVVIGETSELGDYIMIYQGVTLGGTGKESGKRHPNIGNHVILATGCKVIGNITVGDYAKVGAGCVVVKDVPAHSTVVGVPAKVVVYQGIRISSAADEELAKLTSDVDQLKQQVASLMNNKDLNKPNLE